MTLERYTRKTVIRVLTETTPGTNPGGFADTDAVQIMGLPSHRIVRDLRDRDLIRPFLGGSDQLLASRAVEIKFRVELAGPGVAGDAPAWGKLIKACGFAQTLVALTRAEYNPVSVSQSSLSMQYQVDGVVYTCRGARGTAKLNLMAYEIPSIDFTFMGFDTNASEGSVSGTYADWFDPEVVTDGNSGDIKLGGTESSGAVTGGTSLVSRGIEIDIGNTLSHLKMLGGEAIDITRRESTGSMEVGLSAADEVTWRTDINNNVTTGLSFSHGSAAGKQIVVHAGKVQRVDPQVTDYEGRVMMKTELRCLPTDGNDELKIVAK